MKHYAKVVTALNAYFQPKINNSGESLDFYCTRQDGSKAGRSEVRTNTDLFVYILMRSLYATILHPLLQRMSRYIVQY